MNRIESFQVDHTTMEKGIYVSRVDGDIVTYDLRMRKPNREEVLGNASIHTLEHLFATYVRNSKYKDSIIYFGPMGCRTGFYFIVRDLPKDQVLSLIKQSIRFIAEFEGDIPGASEIECGNYREHSLEEAKTDAKEYDKIISGNGKIN